MQAIMEPQIMIDGQACGLSKAGTLWAGRRALRYFWPASIILLLAPGFGKDVVFGGFDLVDLLD